MGLKIKSACYGFVLTGGAYRDTSDEFWKANLEREGDFFCLKYCKKHLLKSDVLWKMISFWSRQDPNYDKNTEFVTAEFYDQYNKDI